MEILTHRNGRLRIHLTLTIFFFAKIVRRATGFTKFGIQITTFGHFLLKIQKAWLDIRLSVRWATKNYVLHVEIRGKSFCHQCTLPVRSDGYVVLINANSCVCCTRIFIRCQMDSQMLCYGCSKCNISDGTQLGTRAHHRKPRNGGMG